MRPASIAAQQSAEFTRRTDDKLLLLRTTRALSGTPAAFPEEKRSVRADRRHMTPASLISLDPEINQTSVNQQKPSLSHTEPSAQPPPTIPSAVLSGMFPICSPRPCRENSLIDPTPHPRPTLGRAHARSLHTATTSPRIPHKLMSHDAGRPRLVTRLWEVT